MTTGWNTTIQPLIPILNDLSDIDEIALAKNLQLREKMQQDSMILFLITGILKYDGKKSFGSSTLKAVVRQLLTCYDVDRKTGSERNM